MNQLSLFLAFQILFTTVFGFPKRLIFELPDREEFCFYQTLVTGQDYIFQFRVIRGGATDVDLIIADPTKNEIKKFNKAYHEEYKFRAFVSGDFSFCFGNTFSTISHKLVFFELRDADFETLEEEAGESNKPTAETALQLSAETIHKTLSMAEDIQTDIRSREREDRWLRYDLHARVAFMSTILAVVIVITGIGQVTILKSLFPEPSRPVINLRK